MSINNDNNKTFTWCGVDLFVWEDWDSTDIDELIFYNCKWSDKGINKLLDQFYMGHPEIPEKSKACDVMIRIDGRIQVDAVGEQNPKTKIIDTYTIFKGWTTDLPSVHSYLGREGDMLDVWF